MTQLREEDAVAMMATATATAQETEIVAVADVSGSLAGTYFEFFSPRNDFYAWFRVSGVGDDPRESVSALRNHIGVVIDITTNDADTVVGAALQAGIDGLSYFSATLATATTTVVNDEPGLCIDALDATSGMAISTSVAGVDGVASTVVCKFLELSANSSVIAVIGEPPHAGTSYGIKNGDFIMRESNFSGYINYTKDV